MYTTCGKNLESLASIVSEISRFKKRDGRKKPCNLPLVKQLQRPQITSNHSKNLITRNLRYTLPVVKNWNH